MLQTTQFYAGPEMVAVEVAAIKADKSMVVNDRVVLLDPATSEVVAERTDERMMPKRPTPDLDPKGGNRFSGKDQSAKQKVR